MSGNSWGGVPTAWGGISPVGNSPLSSWGTIQTQPTLPKLSNTPTTIPLSFSEGQTIVGSPAWDAESRTSTTVYSPYIVPESVASTPPSSWPIPSGPASPSPSLLINPCLVASSPHRVAVDFSIPPDEIPSHPSYTSGASAFSPPTPYARVIIKGPIIWFFELPHSHTLTVATLLSQIHAYLHEFEFPNDQLSSRSHPNATSGIYRDQNLQRGGYRNGVRRIDRLGPRCYLKGFEPAGERNTWILNFRSK